MGGAVVPWFDWSNAYTVVPIAMVVATVVFKLVWKATGNTSASSSNIDEKLPKGVTSLNDSLYQLFAPSGVPQIDIILFHGLQAGDYKNAYWKSWMSKDGKMLWPQTLLGKKFPTARIFSVSYDSATKETGTSGRGDLHLIAENYVTDIIVSGPDVGINRPVVLVGHSLGGLLLKKFVISASQMKVTKYHPKTDAKKIATIDNFLANVCGVFYYSTPHNGTRLADIASKIRGSSEVLAFLKTLSKEPSRLNDDFAHWRKNNDVKATSLGEALPTDPQIWGVKRTKPSVIVEEGSCRNDTDSFYTVPANHITICQPNDMIQSSFQKLEQFLNECLEVKNVVIRLEDPLLQGLDEDPR